MRGRAPTQCRGGAAAWADAPPVAPPGRLTTTSGSNNWVFRLGDDLAVRMPRSDDYAADLLNEIRWLPRLAPELRVPVSGIVAVVKADETFPRPWTVVSWVPGKLPVALDRAEQERFARTFRAFLQSLHGMDTRGAPAGPEHGGYRCGEPVTDMIDGWAEQAATSLYDVFKPAAVREASRRVRDVPPPTDPACLVHTDLSAENLLTHPDGSLAGVIDFVTVVLARLERRRLVHVGPDLGHLHDGVRVAPDEGGHGDEAPSWARTGRT